MELWDACQHEKDIRDELGSREPRDTAYNPRTPNPGDMEGGAADGVQHDPTGGWYSQREAKAERSEIAIALRPEERFAEWAGKQANATRSDRWRRG